MFYERRYLTKLWSRSFKSWKKSKLFRDFCIDKYKFYLHIIGLMVCCLSLQEPVILDSIPWTFSAPVNVRFGWIWASSMSLLLPSLVHPKWGDMSVKLLLYIPFYSLGIPDDPASIATIRSNWEEFVSQNVSLAVFTEEQGTVGQLVGFNILLVKSKADSEEDLYKVNTIIFF